MVYHRNVQRIRNAYQLAVFAALLLAACGETVEPPIQFETTCPDNGAYAFANEIVTANGTVTSASAINIPENAINGVAGDAGGSVDVFSRGYDVKSGNHEVVLRFNDRVIVNVAGDDIVVFENAFDFAGGTFMDLIVVSVSADGSDWQTFPFDYLGSDETKYESNPDLWQGFAGKTPVNYDSEDVECPDPFADASGGDRFDFDDLDDPDSSIRFVRLTAAPTVENPDTGSTFVRAVISDGFDLDGIYARETRAD